MKKALYTIATVGCTVFWAGYIIVDLIKPVNIIGLVCHSILFAGILGVLFNRGSD